MKRITKKYRSPIMAAIIISAAVGVFAANFEVKLPDTNGTSAFQVKDSGSVVLMEVESDGDVGIGTTTPASKLEVNGTVTATDMSVSGTVTANAFSGPITGNASTATALAANGGNCTTGNYPLGVDASGNVESCTAVGGVGSTVESAEITNDTIVDEDINSSAAIDATKIADGTVTSAEFQHLGDVTSDIQTQLDAKQATITGSATTIDAESLIASRALISNASQKVAVSSVTDTELSYVSGVSSAIQNQLNAKAGVIIGSASTIDAESLTASRALISNASQKVAVSSVTDTELSYVSGVGSAIQGQLDGKAGTAGPTFTGTVGAAAITATGTVTANAFSGPITGNASTATALAANGSNCTTGDYPLGVDASGNVESCTSLGLGTIATQDSDSVSITGGSISGITDLALADGGTGASSASAARTSLGVAIGSNVQAYDAELGEIAALSDTDSNFIVGNGTAWVTENGATARTSMGAAASGANSDITSMTGLTSITRATGGSFDLGLGSAPGDDFIVDTTTLVVEGDNNRVGIGTATPSAPLHVYGSATPEVKFEETNAGGSVQLMLKNTAREWFVQADSSPDAFHISDVTANKHPFTILGSSGDVGIGTTSPLTTLDVAGSGRFAGEATTTLTGSIDPDGDTSVAGSGTAFSSELAVGDRITVSGETRKVVAIASNTSLTVDIAFSDNANDTSPAKLAGTSTLTGSIDPNGTAVAGTGTAFTTELAVGDIIVVSTEHRIITAISDDENLTVSEAFSGVGDDASAYKLAPGIRVEGGILVSGGAPGPYNMNNNGYAFTNVNGGDPDSGMFSLADGELSFYTDGTEIVGINTSGASMEVVGGIRVRGGGPGAAGVNNNGYAFRGVTGDNDSGMFSAADGQVDIYSNNGGIARYDGDSNWDFYSDVRLKTGIEDAVGFLEKVMALQVRRYNFKKGDNRDFKEIGFIAQEVEPLFPELVGTGYHPDIGNDAKTLGYTTFGVIAIQALQELKEQKDEEIQELGKKLAALQEDNEQLKERLDTFENLTAENETFKKELKEVRSLINLLAGNASLTGLRDNIFADNKHLKENIR